MTDIDVEALRGLGLTDAVLQRAANLQDASGPLARVIEVHRDRVRLHDGRGERLATASPRLERELGEGEAALVVGDWVVASDDGNGGGRIEARLSPVTHLARRDADGRRRALVSNVDTAFVVMGLDGDFSARRAERYLALVQGSGVTPVLVLTKADLLDDAARDERLVALRRRLPPHAEAVAVDATDPATARQLAAWLAPGQTLVLLGSSGVGKSTLSNTLLGSAVQPTGPVREHDSRGRHTTTSRSLFRLPQGACIIDTPGVRTLRPDVDEAGLAASFADVATLAAACRFRDCTHGDEPGCAVRAGVEADRLRNYHKLLRDVQRDAMTVFDRQRQASAWKARSRSARAWMKAKGKA